MLWKFGCLVLRLNLLKYSSNINICTYIEYSGWLLNDLQYGEVLQLPGVGTNSLIRVKYQNKAYDCKVISIHKHRNPMKNWIYVEYTDSHDFWFFSTETLYLHVELNRIDYI